MDRATDCSCSFTSQSIAIGCKLGPLSLSLGNRKRNKEFVHSKERALYSDRYSELVTSCLSELKDNSYFAVLSTVKQMEVTVE